MNPTLHSHEDKLLELAYGELPAAEARAVEAHVAGCARCSGALADIRGVRQTMSQLQPVPAPDAGLESLLAYANQTARRIQAGPAPRASSWRKWLAPVAGLAALSVLVVVARDVQPHLDQLAPSAALQQQARKEQDRVAERERNSEGYAEKAESKKAAPKGASAKPVAQGIPLAKEAVVGEPVPAGGTAGDRRAFSVDVDSRLAKKKVAPVSKDLLGEDDRESAELPARRAKAERVTSAAGMLGGAAAGSGARKVREDDSQAERQDFSKKLSSLPSEPAPEEEKAEEKPEPARSSAEVADRDQAPSQDAPAAQAAAAPPPPAVAAAEPRSALSLRGPGIGSGLGANMARGGGSAGSGSTAGVASFPPASAPAAAPLRMAPAPAQRAGKKDVSADPRTTLLVEVGMARARHDLAAEQRALNALLPYARSNDERRQWLTQLCNVEFQAGSAGQGCSLLAREFPESSEGQLASRRMRSSAVDGVSGRKASAPAKVAPASTTPVSE